MTILTSGFVSAAIARPFLSARASLFFRTFLWFLPPSCLSRSLSFLGRKVIILPTRKETDCVMAR